MRAGNTRVGELKARQTGDDESMIFPTDTASHCPAEQWVPAMLEGAAPKSTETAAAQHRRTGSWRTRVIGANDAKGRSGSFRVVRAAEEPPFVVECQS